MSTLLSSQVDNMYRHLIDIYETKINDLHNQEIKRIKQSDEYLQDRALLESIIGTVVDSDNYTYEIDKILRGKYKNLGLNSYNIRNFVDHKIKAILSTLNDISFEELVKSVESKLEFDKILASWIAGKSLETSDEEDIDDPEYMGEL